MDFIRLVLAVAVAKIVSFLSRTITSGGGTAAPGLYALKIQPNLIRDLSKRLTKGTIIVAGTNGKTTTARLIAEMLKASDISFVHNKEGSNLMRGFASTLALASDFTNKPIADYALWEVDEATLPKLLVEVQPDIIVLTNLFRDQLDRYGEVEKTKTQWQQALANLNKDTIVIVNANDPSLAYITQNSRLITRRFSVVTETQAKEVAASADANYCPYCHHPLVYEALYYSHIGLYHCANCKLVHPQAEIVASNVSFLDKASQTMITIGKEQVNVTVNLPGFYNLYNALAATAAAHTIGVTNSTIVHILGSFNFAFGRTEEITIEDKVLRLFLVKNPTGFNEILTTLLRNDKHYKHLVIGINDNFADGTDVSWLWDVEFEKLNHKVDQITLCGIRAFDMAVRLKYASFTGQTDIEQSLASIVNQFLSSSDNVLTILPTYTFMLELRKYLAKQGYIKHYLQEE